MAPLAGSERRIYKPPAKLPLKSVALPAEHGGWGVLIEALAVGLVLAPSASGALFAVAALFAWLLRQPLAIRLRERGLPPDSPRRRAATRFCLVYLVGVLIAAAPAFYLAPPAARAAAVLLGVLPSAVLWADIKRMQRQAWSEFSGALSLSSSAILVLLCGGLSVATALTIFAFLALRNITSVLFVRNRLRASRGKPYSTVPLRGITVAALLLAAALVYAGRIAVFALAGVAILAIHSWVGFHKADAPVRPKQVGWQQVALGVVFDLCVVIGFR